MNYLDFRKLSGAVMVTSGLAVTAYTGMFAYNATEKDKAIEVAQPTQMAFPSYKFIVKGKSQEYLGSGQVSTKALLNELTAAVAAEGGSLESKTEDEARQ